MGGAPRSPGMSFSQLSSGAGGVLVRGGDEEAGSFADLPLDSSCRGPAGHTLSHCLSTGLQMLQHGSGQCNNINPQKGGQCNNINPKKGGQCNKSYPES